MPITSKPTSTEKEWKPPLRVYAALTARAHAEIDELAKIIDALHATDSMDDAAVDHLTERFANVDALLARAGAR